MAPSRPHRKQLGSALTRLLLLAAPLWPLWIGGLLASGTAARQVPTDLRDFRTSGTQIGSVGPSVVTTSGTCVACHGGYDAQKSPHDTRRGSLMAQAGRDPLFFAQRTNADQDVSDAGYFCMRCHVPLSFVTGHAYQTNGGTLDATDKDGVSCHFCHAMVDPGYQAGTSPPEDAGVLAELRSAASLRLRERNGNLGVRVINESGHELPTGHIEALRDGNVSDGWGRRLFRLWLATGKGQPIEMAAGEIALGP